MNSSHYPSTAPRSQAHAPRFSSAQSRAEHASAYAQGNADAEHYHDIRPNYPPEVLSLLPARSRVLDVGAGTGKLTAQLVSEGHNVYACDPSRDMTHLCAQVTGVPTWQATAEATAAQSAFFDAVTCAQTWHWVDAAQASREFDRIIKPGGQVVLVWNSIDVSDPWFHRLTRIMHAGDILRAGFYPTVSAPWTITDELRCTWTQPMTFDDILALTATRSYWLRANEKIRERMRGNLEWYFFEHSGLSRDAIITLPYRTDAFVLARRS